MLEFLLYFHLEYIYSYIVYYNILYPLLTNMSVTKFYIYLQILRRTKFYKILKNKNVSYICLLQVTKLEKNVV